MRKHDRLPGIRKSPFGIAAFVAAACAAATLAGSQLALIPLIPSVPWPPAGVALVTLLVFGYDVWPAVLAGFFLGAKLGGATNADASVVAVASSAAGLVGALLANRWACGAQAMERTRCFVRFAIVTGVVAAAVGPFIGFPALALIGRVPAAPAASAALSWWLADGVTTLAVAPALLLWVGSSRESVSTRRLVEALGLAAALGATAFAVFSGWMPAGVQHYPLEVLCVPALLWSAYRFGPRIAAFSVAGLGAIALSATEAGFGPFALDGSLASSVVLFAFIGVSTVTTLALAIVTSERRAAERRLLALARTDGLTGLANFRALVDALDGEVARGMRRGESFALLFFDLDGLKAINDSMGHLAGNRAIIRMANALRASCRSIDTAARIGGDEFCVLLPATDATMAQKVADRVRRALARDWNGPRTAASCGIALYPRDGATSEKLLDAADTLLYGAKARRAKPARARITRAQVAS